MKPALILLWVLSALPACGGSEGPGGYRLLVPSRVAVQPAPGEAVGVPVIVIRRPSFEAPLVGNFLEQSVADLPGGLSVPLRDCDGDPPGEQPPDCPYRSIDPARGQFVFWLTAAVANPAEVSQGVFDLDVGVSTFAQPAVARFESLALSVQAARGAFTVGAPASVSLRDAASESVLLPVTVTADADFLEPVLAGVTAATARDLPAGIEVFARVCDLLARPSSFEFRDPCYDLFADGAELPECRANGRSPPDCVDLLADLPAGDIRAVLILRVRAPGNLGSYPLEVEGRSLGAPIIFDRATLTLNVVSP